MEHSCAADSLRWKWPMVYDLIHSLALHFSNAARLHLKSCVNEEHERRTLTCAWHYTTSALRSGMHYCQRTNRLRCVRSVVKKKGYKWQVKRAMYGTRRTSRVFQEHMKGVFKEAGCAALKVCHQVYHCLETDSTAAIHGDDIIAEGQPDRLDRLDEVLKRVVVAKVLDRVGPRAAEHGRYLKRHIVYINGQGFEWLEDPKHLAAIIRKRSKVGAKPQSSPGSKDFGRSDPEALEELEEVEGKLYQQDTGISIYVSSGRFDIQFCAKRLSEMITKPRKLGNRLARLARYFVGAQKLALRFDHQEYGDTVRIRVDSDWAGSEERCSTHARLESHGEHLVDSWVASDQVRA